MLATTERGRETEGTGMSDLEDISVGDRKGKIVMKRRRETDRLSIDTAVPFSSRLRLRLEHTSHHDHTIG